MLDPASDDPELDDALEFLETTRAELSEIDASQFIRQEPTPRQKQFLDLEDFEAFYGGAAGGGKSSALLIGALQYVHVPDYVAVIVRRKYKDLSKPGAIMDRAKTWLRGTAAKWNDNDKIWTFPSGARLMFGYLDCEGDLDQYQGMDFQFLGVDELTQLPERRYRYLLSRMRRSENGPNAKVPLRARSAGNPGGLGHKWVYERFVRPGAPCRFVPAKLDDNPHLDRASYRESLSRLDSVTRRQLEDGDWIQDSGGLVYSFSSDRNEGTAPKADNYLLGIDYGFTDATAFALLGWREHDPTVWVHKAYKLTGLTPTDAAEEAKRLIDEYQPVQVVADTGGLGKGYAEEARKRFTLPIEPAKKADKRGYQKLFNGELERGGVRVDSEGCVDLIAEWQELPWTEDMQKEADGFENHCADAVLYAWRACSAYHERPKEVRTQTIEQVRREEERRMLEQAMAGATNEKPWWDA